jgi:hypothetical protein
VIHTTLPLPGIWDLITNGSLTDSPAIAFKTSTAEMLRFRWLSSIIKFVVCQGCSPWFEARVGHLTGTTALKKIKTLKFVLLDDPTLPSAVPKLIQVLGLALERKSTEQITKLSQPNFRKAYKSLGYKAATSTGKGAMMIQLYSSIQVVHWCTKNL